MVGSEEEDSSRVLVLRYEAAQKADELQRGLADTLDVKASILLVAVVFLVDVSKRLMEVEPRFLNREWLNSLVQVTNLFLLSLSTIFILLEWWPRRYALPPNAPDEDAWICSIQTEAEKERLPQRSIYEKILTEKLNAALQRCKENRRINSIKSRFLKFGFWATAPVILADVAILGLFAIQKLCPLP